MNKIDVNSDDLVEIKRLWIKLEKSFTVDKIDVMKVLVNLRQQLTAEMNETISKANIIVNKLNVSTQENEKEKSLKKMIIYKIEERCKEITRNYRVVNNHFDEYINLLKSSSDETNSSSMINILNQAISVLNEYLSIEFEGSSQSSIVDNNSYSLDNDSYEDLTEEREL